MTHVLKNIVPSATVGTLSGRSTPEKDLIFVLLYDIRYMAIHRINHPENYSETMDDFAGDSAHLNDEIKAAVLANPKIDPKTVRFYTDPYVLIRAVVKNHDRVKAVLNFCDDFNDRVELMSIPLFFEMYKLPFSCYAAKGLFLSHDKFHSYSIARSLGIPVPKSYFVTQDATEDLDVESFPVIVKPNNAGGSEGISFKSFARDKDQLGDIVTSMLKSFKELIVCDYLPGDELTLGLLKHEAVLIPLTLKSMRFENFGDNPAIYTYDIKWDENVLGEKELIVKPFGGDPAIKDKIVADSTKLFKVLGCKDFARVDWKCDENGQPRFIDFNENPMYGKDSSFLYCLEQAGYTRRDLFNAIIDNTLLATSRPASK
jgi:D-alanine-D-alanine ligase